MSDQPNPMDIYNSIQEQTIAMQGAIRPLAREIVDIMTRFRESDDGKRLAAIAQMVPPGTNTQARLFDIMQVVVNAPFSIEAEYPPESAAPESPSET